jgi:two-component system chemotaxis response regulator CheY
MWGEQWSVITILVVDDEPDLRFVLRRIFERSGYEVAEAGHGAAALEFVRGFTPELVVTDMMMPVMDGAELVRRLRSDPATAGIPILAVSGDSHLAVDADEVIPKPFLAHQVLAAAAMLLARKADRP